MAIYEYTGVVTGIGDLANNRNVISPYVDASIRDFIIGREEGYYFEGPIAGFEYDNINKILSSGICYSLGYFGWLDKNIVLPVAERVIIYGQFQVNKNRNIPDTFKVIATDEYAPNLHDDILNGTGMRVVIIGTVENGTFISDPLTFPRNAAKSKVSDSVAVNGLLRSGTRTPTLSLNDNSRRVANTKYVHDMIQLVLSVKEELIEKKNDSYSSYIKFHLQRKTNFVIITIKFKGQMLGVFAGDSSNNNRLIGTITDKNFLPTTDTAVYVRAYRTASGISVTNVPQFISFKIQSDGKIYYIYDAENYYYTNSGGSQNNYTELTFSFGYISNLLNE